GRNGGHQGGGVDAELSLRLRRAESLFFACAKKSNQKKAQPGREPMRLRRIGPLCSSRDRGTAHNSLRSDTCASSPPVPLRCSARSTAGKSKAKGNSNSNCRSNSKSPLPNLLRAGEGESRNTARLHVLRFHHPIHRRGTSMTALVTLRNITKTYQRGPEKVQVLHGIDLDIERGDFVALMGPSGSGKTTLLNLIGGLDTPSGGEISIEGQRIDQLGAGQDRKS